MRKIAAILFLAAMGAIGGGAILSAEEVEFEIQAGWSEQLFPSFIIATATIKLPDEATEFDDDTSADSDDSDDSDGEDEADADDRGEVADYADEETLEETDQEADDEAGEEEAGEDEEEIDLAGGETLGDAQGLLGITIEAPADETPITVTVSCEAIMAESSFSGVLPVAGEVYNVMPKIRYHYDVLARQTQPGPATVTFTVEVGDEAPVERTETLTLRSINDCPFLIVEEGETLDVCFMFAAYVNEQHPFVDKILREALDAGVVDSFTGYQSKDKAEVYRQVFALWQALSNRDVRYSDITTSSAESATVYSQHVRMIDESINNAQANCVDGSVLLASLLRKVGIEPTLVMVPGHCYLAFALDAEGSELAALETTMIGSSLEGEPTEIEGVENVVGDDLAGENSWRTFTAALSIGEEDLNKNAEQFAAGTDPNFQLIPIAAARRIGILPIAFQADSEFVAAPGYEASE